MTVDRPEFEKDSELDKNVVNDDEIPDFSEKNCFWLWTWCIGPIIKLCLWSFQNYMALKTAFGYIKASQQSLNITVGEETFDASDLGIKVNSNNSDCQNLGNYSPDDGIVFAKLTFCICLIPTVLLSGLIVCSLTFKVKLLFSIIFDGHAQNAKNGRQVELVQYYFVCIWYDYLHGLFD